MINLIDINALILAGGKGSRMNYQNKALLELDSKTFLDRLYDVFSDFNKVYLSLNTSQDMLTDRFIRLDDDFHEIGPISGLYRGLEESDLEYVFVTPCDTPNLTKEFVEYIASFVSPYHDAFIVRDSEGFVHPLLGVYNTRCIALIKEAIHNKNYKILDILKNLDVKYIDLKYTIFDDKNILKNINTPEDYNSLLKRAKKTTKYFAISGIKNSGKTTLITKLLSNFKELGLKVGTIKHDGHDFQMDNLNSDTDKHVKSGAYGTLIFSKSKFMFLENSPETTLDHYLHYFKNYDFIILEGFKGSDYPKLEVIRQDVSNVSNSNKENLMFFASDLKRIENVDDIEIVDINDVKNISDRILKYLDVKSDLV